MMFDEIADPSESKNRVDDPRLKAVKDKLGDVAREYLNRQKQ